MIDGATDAYSSVALEEALLSSNQGLTLRLWRNQKSIILGRGQLARYETDLSYCQRNGIPVVRRLTAGGAIYNGPGNINWSLFLAREFDGGAIHYTWGVAEVFKMAAGLVVKAIEAAGGARKRGGCDGGSREDAWGTTRAWLDEPNRIITERGKVSGMAAYLSKGGSLCHGTLLLDADLEEASRLTRPAEKELERRYTRSRFMAMANTGISSDSFIAAISRVVAEEVGRELEVGEPTEAERRSVQALLPKYTDPVWNLGDPFEGGRD